MLARLSTTALLGFLVIGVPAAVTAQKAAYTRDEVDAAIDIGVRGRGDRIQHACTAEIGGFWNKLAEALSATEGAYGQWHGIRKFRIVGQPPMARVARYAADARRRYEPTPQATDDHIVGMTSDDVFTVWIRPEANGSMITAARLADTGVEHVVIRPRGDREGRYTVQPRTIDVAGSESATNLFGTSVQLEGVVATFASEDVISIAENADVEVLLVTTGGEFKCNLDDTRILRGYNPLDD